MGNGARMLSLGLSTFLALTVAALLAAMPAGAKTCYKNLVPPGQSGSSQYVEVIPTTCGSATPPSGGSGNPNGTIDRLGHGGAGFRGLSHMGPQGRAAAALAAAGAPSLSGSAGRRRSGTSGSTSANGPGADGSGAAGNAATRIQGLPSATGSSGGALSAALGGSSGNGLGVLLPVLLGILLAGALGTGVLRARSGRPPSA